jgi:hypothetical protein
MKRKSPQSLPRLALGALAIAGFACFAPGCETTTTSKGFSSGYNYHKPTRADQMAKNRAAAQADSDSVAQADSSDAPRPSGPDIGVPAPIEAMGKGLGDLFELITPPPPGASQKPTANNGAIPNNFTGTHEVKDANGNTILVHFDRGRIIKKELIAAGSDKPLPDGPKVFRSEQPRP